MVFFRQPRSFIGDEGEPSWHEGRLEEVCLVHDNAADLCLGIQREGQRIEPLKVELEGLAVRQQGLQLLNLLYLSISFLSFFSSFCPLPASPF